MTLHISCSDSFADGYSDGDGDPTEAAGHPKVVDFYLLKHFTNGARAGEPHESPCDLGSQEPLEPPCTEQCDEECIEVCDEDGAQVGAGGATTSTTSTVPTMVPTSAVVQNVSLENTQSQATSLPAVSAPAPQQVHEVLARTGAETDALLTLAGVALLLGGLAVTFGESQAAVERRR